MGNIVNNIVISLKNDMFSRITKVITLQDIKLSNHYSVHLKLM